jgi:hypothetical protein
VRVTKVDRPNTPPGTDIYSYLSHTDTTDVTGTGEVSGDEYRFINPGVSTGGSFSAAATPKGQGVAASFIDEGNEQMVSEGASPNFTLHETTKYTLLSDGTSTAVVENTWTTCTGGV